MELTMANKKISEYINDIANAAAKEGYSIATAAASTFFKVKGELAAATIDSYKNTRFGIRLEDFAYEETSMGKEQKKRILWEHRQ